jgi:hypothetical protein
VLTNEIVKRLQTDKPDFGAALEDILFSYHRISGGIACDRRFVALLLSTAHLPVVNQRALCIILAQINLQAQTTFLVKLPLLVDLPSVLNLRRART